MNAQTQVKDKKKARKISIGLHSALLIFAIIPFMSTIQEALPNSEKVVAVQFTDFKSSSKQNLEALAAPAETQEEEAVEEEVVKPTPPTPTPPAPKPVEEVIHKPVVKAPVDNPTIKTSPKPTPKPVVKPTPKPEKPAVKPKPQVTRPPVFAPKPPKTSRPKPSSGKPNTNPAENPNKGSASSGSNADKDSVDDPAETDGKSTTGVGWIDTGGEGIFNRKVTYRADVKKVTSENGSIVIKLCINQVGRVVYAEYDKDNSTITTPSVIKKAVKTAKKYKFEKDYSAPQKQCGKLTFVFNIEDE